MSAGAVPYQHKAITPKWARLYLNGAKMAHLFVREEPTGWTQGTVCGLWAVRGGIPDEQAPRCRKCLAGAAS